jgi:hypothetical protein
MGKERLKAAERGRRGRAREEGQERGGKREGAPKMDTERGHG